MDLTKPNRANWTEQIEVDQMDLIEMKQTKVDQNGPKWTEVDRIELNRLSGRNGPNTDLYLAQLSN